MRNIRLLIAGLALFTAVSEGAFDVCAANLGKGTSSSPAGRRRKSRRRGRRERGQRAPTPERVSEIQQALAKDGSYGGKPNGKWDASTIEAARKFQAAHGLNPTGKLDAPTLQKLGLGSETTGVAAPLPPVNSASSASPTGQKP